MTALEDRLSAALRARAELVHPEDLAPARVPTARTSSPWRRPATYGLLAAACALAVAIPVGLQLADGDGDGGPAPQPTFTPTPDGEGWDWPVEQEISADVDGDGTDDAVRMRRPVSRVPDGIAQRLEVTLSSGRTVHMVLREVVWFVSGSLDGDSGDGIVLERARGGRGGVPLQVILLDSGALVPARVPTVPPLVRGTDASGRVRDFWVAGETLESLRSLGQPDRGSQPQQVDLWEWSLVEGGLEPTSRGIHCVVFEDGRHRLGEPEPCVGKAPDPPIFYPGQASAGTGPMFAEIDGRAARVTLTGELGGEEIGSDVELRVSWEDGTEDRAPIPAGFRPYLAGVVTTGDTDGILVLQQVGHSYATATVFSVVGDDLVALPQPPDSEGAFGGTPEDVAVAVTWLSEDGHLFSRWGEGDVTGAQVWEWTIEDGRLRAENLGHYCFDFMSAAVPTWVRGDCS